MNEKVLHTLEYNKILDQLTEYAFSADAKSRCQKLRPITDRAQIEQLQQQTSDALSRLFKYGSLSFSGVTDIRDSLKRLEIGGALSAIELLRVCSLLESAKRAKAFARSQDDNDQPDDSLTSLFAGIEPLTPLCDEIRRCILSEDEIADDASSTLHSIRRSMRGMNDKIRAQMNSMINNTTTRSYLQDTVITMRDGRYCLPVKAEAKSLVPGMIHDQSSTGSTLFIEPMAVVNLNNEYKELQLREQEEIEVILAGLSNLTASYATQLLADYELLTELDFIFARAAFAQTYNGVAPLFNDDGRIHIRKGRHPLLDPKKVVPIDVRLGEDFRLLIVTGPNTGGKTVSLKTVGLLTLMGQSGLHIPASERSELGIFDEVFADIGDEQSIEQSLSTFSSHMVNIIRILEQVNDRSLVLFDELCAGTDPTEGAALAISILSKLHLYGARIMATTHYSELKVYALSTPGVENACCEFDVATLSPTYRLLIGIPGKSNAFAISEKLGLPSDLITDAKGRISKSEGDFEDLIADLEKSRSTIEREQLEINQYKAEIESLKENDGTWLNDVYYVFGVQEELGCRGSKVAAARIQPDVGIAVDITPAHDYPCDLEGSNVVGGGVGIKICDPSIVCDEDVVALMESCCEKEQIKYQREVIDKGGTDASSMNLSGVGVRTGGVVVVTRYPHSQSAVASKEDIDGGVDLLNTFCKSELTFC